MWERIRRWLMGFAKHGRAAEVDLNEKRTQAAIEEMRRVERLVDDYRLQRRIADLHTRERRPK